MSLERCGKHRIPIVVKIRSLIVVWCTLAVHGFPSSWRLDSTRASKALFSGANEPVLFYSPNFHRHVIAEFDGQKVLRVIESFLFLDDAEQHYPDARRVMTTHSSKLEMIAGLGMEGRETYLESLEKVTDRLIPATLVSNQHDILADRLSGVCNMLTCKIGSPFLNFFPSDEHDLIYERIQFLLSPLPEVKKDMDWPKSFCDGYGAGLTDEQVVSAILGLRHLLPANPTIALKEKPPITYFISALGITVDGLNEVRGTLSGFLDGECAVDVGTFSHLRALGISWDQCNVLLQSFAATILSCELERTWDLFDGPGLNPLPESSINYLRERFQLYPAEVCCMLRTHSRLSTYSVKILKSHSDALQCQFGLSSRALRQLILRSPSVLGVAEVKVATRASFFRDRLGLSPFEMNKVMQQVPSIIEYSVERNLEPKVDFLINDAGISDCALIKAVTARPFILTSSLEQSLKPCVHGLRQRCDLSPQELSDIISRVPVLLSSKWETNLEPKINFLVNYLNLDRTALKRFVLSSPRILTHSIATSLQPKLKILEDSAGGNQAKVSEVVQDNPSLLELSKIALSRRASMLIFRNITFFEAYSSRKSDLLVKEGSNRKPLVRRKKPVFEMSGESVLQSWTDVASAALSIGSSRANMYNILKTRRTYNGKTYVYGTLPEIHSFHTPRAERMVDCDEGAKTLRDILRQSSMSSCTVVSTDSVGTNYTKVNLAAYVSSGVYPSGKEIRGVRQSGGSLMYFPQLKGNALTTKLLRSAIQATIATQVLPDDAGTTYCEGTVLSFFPGTRPSKNRAGLWVCSNALRVVVELLASDPMFETCDVTVDIITDSTYLVALLRDSEALGRWGSHSRRKDFVYDGPEQPWVVNADLLYPLARTFYRVTKQMLTTPKYGNRRKPLANSISIRFRHRSECTWTGDDPKIQNGNKLAKRAAEWQHDREQSQNF